jgi:hypothetical protein
MLQAKERRWARGEVAGQSGRQADVEEAEAGIGGGGSGQHRWRRQRSTAG